MLLSALRRRPRADGANLHVLEAVLLAFILLGAAYWTTTLGSSTSDTVRPRANLERLSHDTLVVLAGMEEERGNYLDLFFTEALHCVGDEVPSPRDCSGTRGANLSFRIESYLPAGAGYAYSLDNGVGVRELHRSLVPSGEVGFASFAYVPRWNLTFVQPELSCYEAAMDVNATLLPLLNSQVLAPVGIVARASNNATANATLAHDAGWWNVTLPAATRPLAGTISAEVNSTRGTFVGVASYAQCDLGGLGPDLVEAARATPFDISTDVAPLGRTVTFAPDLGKFSSVPGATLVGSRVLVYEPLPGRGTEPDTYVRAARIDLGSGTLPLGAWSVPEDSLYGPHPVVLEVELQVDGTLVKAHRVGVVSVALPTGQVPIDPPYRAVLQAWFPDWT